MDVKEFVNLDPNKVRHSNELMQLFVGFYETAFFVKPSCAGCVFKTGFQKLKKHVEKGNVNFKKEVNMKKQTFILNPKYRNKILSYKHNGIMYRSYGYNMTEDFAKELVNRGQSELFIKIPEVDVEELKEVNKDSKYYSMDYRNEVLPLYAEVKERTGDTAGSNKKDDIIAFLDKYED